MNRKQEARKVLGGRGIVTSPPKKNKGISLIIGGFWKQNGHSLAKSLW
jgi:hypothetical protein